MENIAMKERALGTRLLILAAMGYALIGPAPARAQQGQAPQGGQTPAPQPQPQPTPQPRPPTNNPSPQPTAPTNQVEIINIRGRIITGAHAGMNTTEVRFETEGGQPIGFA